MKVLREKISMVFLSKRNRKRKKSQIFNISRNYFLNKNLSKNLSKKKHEKKQKTLKCNLCKKNVFYDKFGYKMFDIDHILPRHLNGTNKISNLQILCLMCHRQKTNLENYNLKKNKKNLKKKIKKIFKF